MNVRPTLQELIDKYGSDKNYGEYTPTYEDIFKVKRDNATSILEIGIGTLNPHMPSSFVGNLRYYPEYKPGGSLKAWRDFFPNATIYGVDIAEDCMFEDERIKTFLFDSSNKANCIEYLGDLTFDIIIDDGNHDPRYQINTLMNLLPLLKPGGIYVIEDIGGYGGKEQLFVDYNDEFESLTKGCTLSHYGNHIAIFKPNSDNTPNFTVVTGLWDLGNEDKDFNTYYLPKFVELLKSPVNLYIFGPKSIEDLVWEHRERYNTRFHIYELSSIRNLYDPHWDNTQKVRTEDQWLTFNGNTDWVKDSLQVKFEYYLPIVQSKIFMLHDSTIYNPFNTDYFYWVDAAITDSRALQDIGDKNCLENIIQYTKPFLFLSYPVQSELQVNGFRMNGMESYAGEKINHIVSGQFFGGHKQSISQANATYYSYLKDTLGKGYLGTEESIFTIMSHREPYTYKRFELNNKQVLSQFTQALLENNATVTSFDAPVPKNVKHTVNNITNVKTNLYILTFNFPEQILHTLESMKKVPEWLEKPHLVLLDNSTDKDAKNKNIKIAKEYGFEYIDLGKNSGICGGRQAAAEHFHNSNADYYFFFEDDMTSNPPELEGKFCRNGFRKYIPNLYTILHKIIIKEDFDYLKLSFTEVYWDNDIQTSWYNVPQDIRTKFWPDYDKLPVSGADPHAPRTQFDKIGNVDGVAYISGDVTYTNWPMIMSKKGNQKVFIDTKWDHPFEQTWMSNVFQLQKEGKINAAVLLASPIWHERIKYYKPEERREN